jgi:DNA polymerase-3 subunit alpha
VSFVHLHSHTHYSLLDGAAKINEIINRTSELGMNAIAITDHGNMFGSLEFYTRAVRANIKPIIGVEAYLAPRERTLRKPVEGEATAYHLVLLAKNEKGYRNLIKLTSYSYLEGMYYKPRIDKALLRQHSEGLIATSACMKGEIPYKLRTGRKKEAIKAAEEYKEIFGDDFYLEIQDHHIPEEQFVYPQVYELAKEMNIPVIATNDNHYLYHGDHEAHDILLCLQTGKDRDDPNRLRYGTEDLYLKSPDEMFQLFKDKMQVLERTLEIEEKIDLNIDFDKRHLPVFPIPNNEGDIDADEYLKRLSYRGAKNKYGNVTKEVTERIEHELTIIKNMGFAGYFLITQDFIQAAKDKDIPVGLGRGSAAGSIVAYNLGITDVDPLRYGLLFERFLNPERITMPDIDIDFCVERRDEVIEYVREKYGKKNVAQIITFGTMASRGVIRDVSRVLKIPIPKADAIAKQIPIQGAKPIPLVRAFDEVPELKEIAGSEDNQLRELVRYSKTLEGIARHSSVHAAGIIIAPDDITNFVPLYKNSDQEITTQWTMGWCEDIGLLKMDFLGLRNLTVIRKAEEIIRQKYDKEFNVENISLDDEKTYELFGEGLTVGVFQFESAGMQEYLRKLKPSRIEDLIAMNALYRPGPMQMIDDFIDRKYGRKKIVYLHPKLEDILTETYGIIVYQEQVMQIASELAGFSLAQADLMRRAMGKKKKEAMAEQKDKFIKGCMENGIKKNVAKSIAELIEKFAQYGFNKSHSTAYAIIAYQTAYLKAHFPAEFMSANLSSEVGNSDRVMILMEECRKLGIKISPPDVNYSEAQFVPVNDDTIAFGLAAIKNVGAGAITSIVESREQIGKFNTLFDLVHHVDMRLVNKKVLENLAMAGAMDSLEGNRAQLFNMIETAIEFGQNVQNSKTKNKKQRSIFELNGDESEESQLISYPEIPDLPDWSVNEKLKKEKELLGFYISGHPLENYRPVISLFTSDIESLLDSQDSVPNKVQILRIAGQIVDLRFLYDKKQQKMAFVKLEDYSRTYEIVVFSSVFPQFEHLLKNDEIVMIQGRLNSDLADNMIKLIGESIIPLQTVPELLTDSIMLLLEPERFSETKLHDLKMAFRSSPGNSKIIFRIADNGTKNMQLMSRTHKINLSFSTLNQLSTIIGTENIRIKIKETQ